MTIWIDITRSNNKFIQGFYESGILWSIIANPIHMKYIHNSMLFITKFHRKELELGLSVSTTNRLHLILLILTMIYLDLPHFERITISMSHILIICLKFCSRNPKVNLYLVNSYFDISGRFNKQLCWLCWEIGNGKME